MARKFLQIASLAALLAVVLGAFAAHGLQSKISPDQITVFQTGVRYQFYHAFGIFITAILMHKSESIWLKRASWSFLLGIVLFSGSLYLLSCRDWLQLSNWKWLGPITPIGGIFFIFGWGSLFLASFKSNDNE
jgi:uncharacterized membrane protein YgdD (TMEM256/DUF423 family)